MSDGSGLVVEWRRPTGLQTQIESGSNNWPGEVLALPDQLPRTLLAIVELFSTLWIWILLACPFAQDLNRAGATFHAIVEHNTTAAQQCRPVLCFAISVKMDLSTKSQVPHARWPEWGKGNWIHGWLANLC